MITPRTTRLVRVPDLHAFRDTIAQLAGEGEPVEARDRLVIVPSRAAASHLTRAIEDRTLDGRAALILPELVTRDELYGRLAARLPEHPQVIGPFEREVLLGVACRAAEAAGVPAPFRLRPGLIAEILRFYDELQRRENDVDTFETRALRMLEPGADVDRGAERLVRQTRFLVAAFREFERRCRDTGAVDEHTLRRLLRETPSDRPWRHAVVTVRDRAADPHGLWTCDLDLLTRIPGLLRLDLVVTETCLAGALHERLHALLPGLEEVRWPGDDSPRREPTLLVPVAPGLVHFARDREEEVAGFARRLKQTARETAVPLDRVALVVRQPLPYVYVAREVFRSARIPCQMLDALPLAAEPFAAALDQVFVCVASNFARSPLIGLLGSPHFRFAGDDGPLTPEGLAVLDRSLSEAGYLGDLTSLESLAASWAASAKKGNLPEPAIAVAVARALSSLREPAPVAQHLDVLLDFLHTHEVLPRFEDPLRERQLRARAAILAALAMMRGAFAAFDPSPREFDEVVAMVRRWIEAQTFAPRRGDTGIHLVDAQSAPYGDFDDVQLAGLVEREWPESPRRSIFYSPAVLRELGWPSETDRLDGARNAFIDLLRLAARRLVVSSFTLEEDTVVSSSPFLDELEHAGLPAAEEVASAVRLFELEALALDPVRADVLPEGAGRWARLRVAAPPAAAARYRGATTGHEAPAFSVSALERYQDCPFKFFAADVLKLEEAPEDEPTLSPRARGRFIHEVFQRFFEAWDHRGDGTVTVERLDDARALFREVAEPLLARLPDAEAALERTRLLGSAIAVGIVDVVLGLEASRPAAVKERWLEYRLDGEFTLGGDGDRMARLRGVADRIDLLAGNRLRVIDYKSGYPPNPKRALQVPVYALCAAERLAQRDGAPWMVDEAAYVAFSGKRALVPVVRAGANDPAPVLAAARGRLFDVLDGIGGGEFPPRPHDPMICNYCAFASVCRKDYVGDE